MKITVKQLKKIIKEDIVDPHGTTITKPPMEKQQTMILPKKKRAEPALPSVSFEPEGVFEVDDFLNIFYRDLSNLKQKTLELSKSIELPKEISGLIKNLEDKIKKVLKSYSYETLESMLKDASSLNKLFLFLAKKHKNKETEELFWLTNSLKESAENMLKAFEAYAPR